MSTKKQNKRRARKAGVKWVSDVKFDSMKACKRNWGEGRPK